MQPQIRCVFGVPTYNSTCHAEQSLRSLLAQSSAKFRVIACDDDSTDGTQEVLKEIALQDARLTVNFNEKRLGYIGNARKVFDLAGSSFPEAEFFAWGSDHDLWHPDWLARLIEALDANPDAVAAWPWFYRIDESGAVVGSGEPSLGDGGSDHALARVRFVGYGLHAGSSIYGLFRRKAIERVGGLQYAIDPDRLLFAQLALLGPFVQVEDRLWSRRYQGLASRQRQRRSFFPDGAPLHSYLPRGVQHAFALASAEGGVKVIFAYLSQRRFRIADLLSRRIHRLNKQLIYTLIKPARMQRRFRIADLLSRRIHRLNKQLIYTLIKPARMQFHRLLKRSRQMVSSILRMIVKIKT